MIDQQAEEELSDGEVRALALVSGLLLQQADLAVALNREFGTRRAMVSIKAFVKINALVAGAGDAKA